MKHEYEVGKEVLAIDFPSMNDKATWVPAVIYSIDGKRRRITVQFQNDMVGVRTLDEIRPKE